MVIPVVKLKTMNGSIQMGKHNLSVGVVMMLINDGFIQEKDEEEAIDAVNDLLDDWFALSNADLDFPWDEDQS